MQKRLVKIAEIKRSMKMGKNDADREIAEGVQVFMALKEFVDKGLDQLIKEIEDKQTTAEKRAGNLITELEKEISELKKRSTESLRSAPPTKDWTNVRIHPPSHQGTVVRAVAQLEESFAKETKKIKKAELKRVQQFAVDVTLDPDTAYPRLILSDDGKQVTYGDVMKNLPDNPKRFSSYPNVLGKQSFSSGKFYFEVQVKGKTEWDLGVARTSVNRKGTIILSPKDGFWTIWLRKVNKSLLGPAGCFSLRPQPEKVGVFVDYDEGVVSFHDVGTAALIFSFTGCNFTDNLHPIFNPSMQNENSVPLIICPVNQTT
ncbi:E3 ubiquitin-protein ligase TRIM21-like [Solea senegalensis]|nr:E3 ubiquitin-protein ligase TRIM21-like [Solea senegalensis]